MAKARRRMRSAKVFSLLNQPPSILIPLPQPTHITLPPPSTPSLLHKMPTTYFGCKQCAVFFPTLDLGLQHVRRSPIHHADTLELIEKFDTGYRVVAARTLLFSFTISSDASHDAAIAQAELQASAAKAGVDAALRAKRVQNQRPGSDDDGLSGALKRPCLEMPDASCSDVSYLPSAGICDACC